jgi:SAM-dependent methyltransferase
MDIHKVYRVFMMRFRPARMKAIKDMFTPTLDGDGSVIDLGGTAKWWKDMNVRTRRITIINLDDTHKDEVLAAGYQFSAANACKLPYASGSFDLAFSNSVIEHVGQWEDQVAFAREMLRCGKQVYMQTPNKWFPVEPHLIALFIHWLPFGIQRRLVPWFSIWAWVTRPDQKTIDDVIKGLKLLSRSEVEKLFPGCEIRSERVLGLTKSFIVTKR